MYLDKRTEPYRIISQLPRSHIFIASMALGIPSGCGTGEFQAWDDEYHIAEGFLPFTETRPDYDTDTQELIEGSIVVAGDGKSANKTWTIRDKADEVVVAAAWVEVRNTIARLIAESNDKWDMPNSEEWISYRQSLRAIPENFSNIDDIIWPETPV